MDIKIEVLYNKDTDRYSALNLETMGMNPIQRNAANMLKHLFGLGIYRAFPTKKHMTAYVKSLK